MWSGLIFFFYCGSVEKICRRLIDAERKSESEKFSVPVFSGHMFPPKNKKQITKEFSRKNHLFLPANFALSLSLVFRQFTGQ